MTGSIILSLIQNTAILLSFAMLYDYLWIREQGSKTLFQKVLAGFFISGVGLVLMLTPWTLAPGLVFDTRTILLSISGLFFGVIPTVIAIVLLGFFRIVMSGDGMWMGLAVVLSSGSIGILWNKLRPSWRNGKPLLEILAMGVLVHLVMLSCTLLLPDEYLLSTLKTIAIPIVFIYSPGTMLLGGLMLNRVESWKNKRALLDTKALYSSLVEQMPAGIFRKTAAGRYDFVNSLFCDLKGLKQEEIIGKTPRELVAYVLEREASGAFKEKPRQFVMDSIGDLHHDWIMANGKPIIVEEEYPQSDGRFEFSQVVKTPIFDADHRVVGSQGIIFDITLQKQLQSELLISKQKAEDSDRLKTAFLHNISHEIRTPMNAIIGFSDFLKDVQLPVDKRIHYADVIIQSSRQLLSIIDDIVRIATIEAGQEKMNEVDFKINSLCWLVYDQFADRARQAKLDFQVKIGVSDEDPHVLSDETKVLEILSNLLVNALKFTNNGHIYFGYTVKENELEFFVEDTGIGVEKDMTEEIFKRFRQAESTLSRQFGGSGLGLSICKAYVELLGGRLWVDSELGKGSTFYFTLPYRKVEVVDNQAPVTSSANCTKNKNSKSLTILVAEDEDLNFILLKEILSSFEVNVLHARNGIEAIMIATTREDVDLILMDLKMPVMDGYEATRKIKKVRPSLPIFALTAYSQESDKAKAFYSGCQDFISKPFNKNELIEKIRVLIN